MNWTWRRLINSLAFGTACGLAITAVAVVTGYALAVVQTEGDALHGGPGNVTPTVLQMKQALEYMASNRPAQSAPSQSGGGSGGGGAGAGTQATATPETPEARPGGGATPSLPSLGPNDVTPQPTTTANSAAIPTRTPFTPPTIVPIQPLAPTPASVQPAAPATSIPAQPIAPAATSVPPQPQSTPPR